MFVSRIEKATSLYFLTSSVDGVTAALPVGLVHGRSLESTAGTHYHAFNGGPHIPQGPTAGLHLQGESPHWQLRISVTTNQQT